MLSANELYQLNQKRPLRVIWDVGLCWAVILGNLYICHLTLWFIPIALVLIATRLHAMAVMMHDGAHHLLFQPKWLNDLVSNLFCAFPIQLSTHVYRQTHNDHHRYTQTEKDPNYKLMQREQAWHFPKPKAEVKRILVKDLMLTNIPEHLLILKLWQIIPNFNLASTMEKFLFPLYMVATLAIVAYWQLWVEFVVLQAAALFINPIARVRPVSEHVHAQAQGQGKVHKLQETPTINANWLERFFIAPYNTNRHLEHHLYPTIPYYNLERVHNIIRQSEMYRENCVFELDGYLMGKRNALNEILSQEGIASLQKKPNAA